MFLYMSLRVPVKVGIFQRMKTRVMGMLKLKPYLGNDKLLSKVVLLIYILTTIFKDFISCSNLHQIYYQQFFLFVFFTYLFQPGKSMDTSVVLVSIFMSDCENLNHLTYILPVTFVTCTLRNCMNI